MGLVGGRVAAAHRGAVEKVQYFAYHPRSPYSVIPGCGVAQIRCSGFSSRGALSTLHELPACLCYVLGMVRF